MIIMGVNGGSWVGDMYKKFEAMCVEVEEVIYEDTFKYVENQVWTVGETVKKFYSDVMQDLLPPSSLESEKAHEPLSNVGHDTELINSTKTKLDAENGLEQLVEDIGVGATHEDSQNDVPSCSPMCSIIKPYKHLHNYSAEEMNKEAKSLSQVTPLALSDQDTSKAEIHDSIKDSQYSLSNIPMKASNITNNDGVEATLESCRGSAKSSPPHEDASSKEVPAVSHSEEDELGICSDLTEHDGGGTIIDVTKMRNMSGGDWTTNFDKNFSTDADLTLRKADLKTIITSNVENSVDVDKELSMFDRGDEEGFLVGQLNEFKLEESCVLVGKNDILSNSGSHMQKSYKKKIQNVFYPRRWSRGKRDQDQLAARYVEQCGKNSESTTSILTELRKSQTNGSFESDWELL